MKVLIVCIVLAKLISKSIANGYDVLEQIAATGFYKSIAVFNKGNEDWILQSTIQLSHQYELNCFVFNTSKLPIGHDTIIVLNKPGYEEFNLLFNQQNVQKSFTNTWLIFTPSSEAEISNFFNENQIKIGINAILIFVQKFGSTDKLIQAHGMGSTKPQLQVL